MVMDPETSGLRLTAPLAGWTLTEWLDALSRQDPTPAGGSLALLTLAGAAALAAKIARLAQRDPAPYERVATAFLNGAQRDGEAYVAARREGETGVRACLELGIEHLGEAVGFLESLAPLFEGLSSGLTADLAAAERLARSSAQTLLVNLAVNLSEWSKSAGGLHGVASALENLKHRLEAA